MKTSLWLWRILALFFLALFIVEAYEGHKNAQLLRQLQESKVKL